MKKAEIIDIFVTVIDNYGDMGFALEFVIAIEGEYGEQYECIIWTDDVVAMSDFVTRSGIGDITIGDISDFAMMRKSAIGVSILHAPIPDLELFAPRALILRIDYLSLDPLWLAHNEREHILSTPDRQIIELIPSPLEGGVGLIAPMSLSSRTKQSETAGSVAIQVSEHGLLASFPVLRRMDHASQGQIPQKHITIFVYPSTLDRIDWDSFPSDIMVYVFGGKIPLAPFLKGEPKFSNRNYKNIICLDFLPIYEFYELLDTSEFVIIRGEVSWAHMIQGSVPFFWDMYRDMGGFPSEQSDQFLDLIGASSEYREMHQIFNGQKEGKISYSDILGVLSHTRFAVPRIHNLIHTVKKHIDRFQNSI